MTTPVYEVQFQTRTPAQSTAPTLSPDEGITRWSSLKWGTALNAPDRYTVSAPVGAILGTPRSSLLTLDTTPLELLIRRDGVLVGQGPITDWSVKDREITIEAMGVLGYLKYMVQEGSDTYTAQKADYVVKTQVAAYQALDYGNYGIDLTALSGTDGVARDLVIDDHRDLLTVFTDWLEGTNGADWWVSADDRKLRMSCPDRERGSDLTASVVLDARSLRDAEVMMSVAPGVYANVGIAFGREVNSAVVENATPLSEFGRAGVAVSLNDVTTATDMTAAATELSTQFATAATAFRPELLAVAGASVDDFDVGDTVAVVHDFGLGVWERDARIKERVVSVTRDAETLEVGVL